MNTDEPDSKDYSNHSSSNYERKKNLQNSNRKPYMGSGGGGGSTYRGGNPNVGLNSHHSNSNAVSMNNNASIGQSNVGTSVPPPQSQQPPPNQNMRKGPLIHHPMSESSGHIYSSGAGHHHENTPPYNQRVNSTQNSTYINVSLSLS